MKRNGLALLLVLIMLVSVLPVSVDAEGLDTDCEHKYTTWIITEFEHSYECQSCGKIIIPMEMHNMVDGQCTICSFYPDCPHKNLGLFGGRNDGYHYLRCNDCYEVFDDTREKHTNLFGFCTICKDTNQCNHENTKIEWLPDSYDPASSHHSFCTYCCSIFDNSFSSHDFIEGKCSICGYFPTCTHQSSEWHYNQIGHRMICSHCGNVIGEFISHTMFNGSCSVCGYAPCPNDGHTLYTGRYYAHICQTCGYTVDPKDVDNDGWCDCCCTPWSCCHNNTKWTYDTEYAPEYHYQECVDCGQWLYESWSEHTPVNGVCSVCGYECETVTLGDPNGDGKINAKDATLILQYSVGVLKENQSFDAAAADVSGDGKLNAKDATLILQFSVGLRDSFPAG